MLGRTTTCHFSWAHEDSYFIACNPYMLLYFYPCSAKCQWCFCELAWLPPLHFQTLIHLLYDWQYPDASSFHHVLLKFHSFTNVPEDWGEFDFGCNPPFWPFSFLSFTAFTNNKYQRSSPQHGPNRLCSFLDSSLPLRNWYSIGSIHLQQPVVFINSLQLFVIFKESPSTSIIDVSEIKQRRAI